MRYIGFLITLIITASLGVVLSISINSIPPLGILLDPHHGFWQHAYSEDALAQESIALKNLKGTVEVVYDEHLIPHIFAENDEDLYRVQGYVTAQHRLWQMEFQTMAASGRISEIVGDIALDIDRMARRKGLPYAAEVAMQYLEKNEPETIRLVEAYADGVNQYIDNLSIARLPLEYKILNYRPESWSAYKSMLLLKYMADMLVGDRDLEFTNLRNMLGSTVLGKLYPDFPRDNDPIIEASKIWDFEPLPVSQPQGIQYPKDSISFENLTQPVEGTGSNNWAVHGSKTASGSPILANDPHLSLNLPSIWYSLQLSTPDHTVKGASLPGALGIISGFNEHIAWGVTNATRDTRDWYKITFKDGNRAEYLYNDRYIQSTFRIETFKIKGQEDFIDTIVYTHHGPIVFDKSFRGDRSDVNYALRWTAHMESNEQRTFLELNKAKDHDDYIEALNHYTSPAQNFVFASKSGDIAMKVQGRFPLKWAQQGKFLMDGNDPAYEWQGFIPNEHNPATLNPARGYVSSANQHPVDPSYPYFVFDGSYEHYRNRRLNSRLEEMQAITIEDMQQLQFDNFNLHAAEALPIMLNLLDFDESTDPDSEDARYFYQLAEWNFYTHPNQTEPTLFQVWWDKFYELTWDKWKKENHPILLPNKYQTTLLLAEEPESEFFDKPETPQIESGADLVKEAYKELISFMKVWNEENEEYSWATYKNTTVQHLVPNFKSFSRSGVYTGGGAGILNATSSRHGASWRMVVEMGDQIKAYGIYPGGQSGNPGSKFYDHFLKTWAIGSYANFDLRTKNSREGILFTTKFSK
ncbi:penicillin acylase family protein [Mongoliitalea daihaiensis]|uniref:penicillin acylase family protein n=1 Tax=Mongoliitalea daihaiensis TaxID=2782006 RepID=UPI001F313FAB|nr:penicillin acylase family protein [Mongoliitalea daihaiensis]UJP63373.1 penicillin acylase family protein [Mongoliitalea daihaiensis]